MKLSVIDRAKYTRYLRNKGYTETALQGMGDNVLAEKYNAAKADAAAGLIDMDDLPDAVIEDIMFDESIETPPSRPLGSPYLDTPAPAAVPADGVAAAISEVIGAALSGFKAGIDEQAVIDLIKQHATVEQRITHTITIDRPDHDELLVIDNAHPILPKLLSVLKVNMTSAHFKKPYLVGPAGSGKTTICRQAAKALGKDFYFTGSILEEHKLMGFVDAGGHYHRTPFRDAVEHGGLFLFDEIAGSIPAVILTINAVLANGLVTFPDGVTFEINPERTLFVAADNTLGTGATGDYAARFALDKSTLDRFVRMIVDYDNDVERTMAINGWRTAGGLPEQEDVALSWYQEVVAMRAAVAKARIDVLISPRATETGAALLAQGMPFDDVKHDLLLIDLSEDQIKQLAV